MRPTNSSTMESTHQYQTQNFFLSGQAKHSEIFPDLHSSLISIRQFFEDGFIVTFDKHKFIVIKNRDIIIEGYREPTNGIWIFPLHHPAQNNKQANIMEPHLCKPQYINGATAPQSISTNSTARIRILLSSDPLMPDLTHPDLCNQ